MINEWIIPDWPAPPTVRACSTTRMNGFSCAPWDSFNLATHVGDDESTVQKNRQRLVESLNLPAMPVWPEQVHGTAVLRLDGRPPASLKADAVWSGCRSQVCAVMTADCLPVLFCSADGTQVAAAHAGWRGLCAGVLEATLAAFRCPPSAVHAWLGPAIGPQAFEVGSDVFDAFVLRDERAASAFTACGQKYYADITLLARQRLQAKGVASVSGGGFCTVSQQTQFFSFRRDGITGRMASLIWLI